MNKTLGLDLGSNSLGWAVLDDLTGDILNKGVVVFPEGVEADDSLDTPAAKRRQARMGRRMKFRRKTRKWALLKILINNKMCPMTQAERLAWKNNGKYPVDNKAFVEWLKSTDTKNPYADRARAVEGPIDNLTLGRALYHLCQRRGFKSSRKEKIDTGDEKVDEKENAKRLGKVATDIAALTKEISDAGCKTLGQYFAKCIDDQSGALEKRRVRCRYTGRIEHYEIEFAAIMAAQKIAETSDLYKELHKAIFMQRPLRSQKHLVGKCPLEPKSPRCRISHPVYEEYRMLSFVNNLTFERTDGSQGKIPLTAEDRALVCSAFYKAAPSIKFAVITKLFKKRFEKEGLQFHYYRNEETVSTCSMRHRIAKAFGEKAYDEQMVFEALCFFDNDEKLAEWFAKHYPTLSAGQIKDLVKINPKEGNANYSLKAIGKMLPFLRKGFQLADARFLAKMPDLIPDFAAREDEIVLHLRELQAKYRQNREALKDEKFRRQEKSLRLMDLYHDYFRDNFNFDEETWGRLYLRGDSAYAVDPKNPTRLPKVELGMIRNPLVQRSMTTLRRLVNYLRDHGIIDGETTIRIELVRSVNDYATRHAIQTWQKARAAEREEARIEIEKLNVVASDDAIDRYILCKEQNWQCLYTGRTIKLADVLSGKKFDIEHTIPRSRSGDDSLANKTICEQTYNRQDKKGRIPRECANWDEIDVRLTPWKTKVADLEKLHLRQKGATKGLTDPQAKSAASIKAKVTWLELTYWRDKLRRFMIEADRLEDSTEGLGGFKKRQLVDTGVMCAHAVEFLRSVYPRVYSVNGAATAFARKAWGVQGDEKKDRTNHTHHAKDAMVIAALTPARFNAICTALKDDGASNGLRECDVCPSPFEKFAEKIRQACEEILVKHVVRQTTLRQSTKKNALARSHVSKSDPSKVIKHVLSKGDTVRGPLHKKSFYGRIRNPEDGKMISVQRVQIPTKVADAEKIVSNIIDPAVRLAVGKCLDELKGRGETIVTSGAIHMSSGVPIRRVRVVAPKTFQNPIVIREQAFGSKIEYKRYCYAGNAEDSYFRLALFNNKGVLSAVSENRFRWAKDHKRLDYVPLDQKPGFMGYVYQGCMALTLVHSDENLSKLTSAELRNRLYVLRSTGSDADNRAQFTHANCAGEKKSLGSLVSEIDVQHPPALLRLPPSKYLTQMLFEGVHFRMMLDGSIRFL